MHLEDITKELFIKPLGHAITYGQVTCNEIKAELEIKMTKDLEEYITQLMKKYAVPPVSAPDTEATFIMNVITSFEFQEELRKFKEVYDKWFPHLENPDHPWDYTNQGVWEQSGIWKHCNAMMEMLKR